jgi:hypothetical protein
MIKIRCGRDQANPCQACEDVASEIVDAAAVVGD